MEKIQAFVSEQLKTEVPQFGLKLLTYKSLDLFHFRASFKLRTFIQSIVEDRPDNITVMPLGIVTDLVIISQGFKKIKYFFTIFAFFYLSIEIV